MFHAKYDGNQSHLYPNKLNLFLINRKYKIFIQIQHS